MDQKSYELSQKPKLRKKRAHKDKRLRVAGATATKKNRGRVKMNKCVLELEAEIKRLRLIIKLIENHAAISFNNELLGYMKEVKKDPFGFEQALKKKHENC